MPPPSIVFSCPACGAKLTLPDEGADATVAVAVADKLSGIGKALTDSVITGLNWDQPKPCLVMLQWNMENPTKPYLEALEAKRLDWEPR